MNLIGFLFMSLTSLCYHIGPYAWTDIGGDEFAWCPPDEAVAAFDLRNFSLASDPKNPGMGLFVTFKPLDSGYELLGQGRLEDFKIDQRIKDAFAKLCGLTVERDTLADAIHEFCLTHSAPDWSDALAPLMPCSRKELYFRLQGHRVTLQRKFLGQADDHWNKVRDVLRNNYREIFNAVQTDAKAEEFKLDQKWLGTVVEKYELKGLHDWKEVVPADLLADAAPPLKPSTTYSDNFNRANSDPPSANGGVTLTEVSGTTSRINSNVWNANGATNYNRHETDLSTDDMYVQADVVTAGAGVQCGVLARYASAADTGYVGRISNSTTRTVEVYKRVATVMTLLAQQARSFPSLPVTVKLEVDGSTLQLSVGGVIMLGPFADTSITANTRAGHMGTSGADLDNFSIGDTTITAISSTGLTSPGTITDDNAVGTETWSTVSNAGASDNSYTTCSPNTTGVDQSHYLKCTNYSYAITSSAILGVQLCVERKSNKNTASDMVYDTVVKLVKGGTVSGNNLTGGGAASGDRWATTEQNMFYGGAGELWGNTLAESDIEASNFGVVLSVTMENDAATVASVDAIKLEVFYTPSVSTVSRTIIENLGIPDAAQRLSIAHRSIADAIGSSQAISTTTLSSRSIADAIGSSDILFHAADWQRSINDSIGAGDSIAIQTIVNRLVAIALGISDGVLTQNPEVFGAYAEILKLSKRGKTYELRDLA